MDSEKLEACRTSIENIKTHFEANPSITIERLDKIVRTLPTFESFRKIKKLDPRRPETWRALLFNGNASSRLYDIVRAASRIAHIIRECELIDLPEMEASNYPNWLAEVDSRLLVGVRRDLHFLGGAAKGLRCFNDLAKSLMNVDTVIYNTVFTRTSPDSAVGKQNYSEFEATKRDLLNAGDCNWNDIVLASEWNSYRQNMGKLFSAPPEKLKPRVVDVTLPLLQGLAVRRGDNDFVLALVGWMFPGATEMRVYSSDHRDNVIYFYDYLQLLHGRSEVPENYELKKQLGGIAPI